MRIDWIDTTSWVPWVSRRLRPVLKEGAIRALWRRGEQDICWDDGAWLKIAQDVLAVDVPLAVEELSTALFFAEARVYHGCRTDDAGGYRDRGLRRNDPAVLAEEVRRIVREEDALAYLRSSVERRLYDFDGWDRDTGKVHVAMGYRYMIELAGHYLLYGSEWIQCVLGWGAHATLRQRGVPTVFVVDLPLNCITFQERRELAEALVREWTRIKVNRPDWVPELDCAFALDFDISGELIAGHFHPEVIHDQFYNTVRRPGPQRCPDCMP